MAIDWIDSENLASLLDGGTAILISNDSRRELMVTIVGVACALHADQPFEVRRSSDVMLEAGDSLALVEDCFSPTPPIAVESILRVVSPLLRDITDVYIRSDESRTTPIESIEIGLTGSEFAPADAVTVPGMDGVSAYVRLEP